jgi:hypothetical protein
MDESDLILEFMKISRCSRADAIDCLSTWNFDLKKALIDYNGKLGGFCMTLRLLTEHFSVCRHFDAELLQDQKPRERRPLPGARKQTANGP